MFNHNRFAIARKRRGFTKIALAKALNISTRSISAYESGDTLPEKNTLSKISEVLNFPISFFFRADTDVIPAEMVSFRSLKRMTALQRDMALSSGSIALTFNKWLEDRFNLPKPDLPEVDLYDSPDHVAEIARDFWQLGELPIKNMIHFLESKGIRVFSLAIQASEVDAFSFWQDGVPFVFLNMNKTAERCRFDAAHELGHLIMHKDGLSYGQDAEKEANTFASAFLMPRRSLLAKCPRLVTLKDIIDLKKIWNVSAAALNYRLHSLNVTSDWTYRSLCISLARNGRDKEPSPSQFESSQVLNKVFECLRQDGISKFDVSNELDIPLNELEELTFGLPLTLINGGGDKSMQSNNKGHLKIVT